MQPIKSWGREYRQNMQIVADFSCPNPTCKGFSFFCNGDFERHASTIWRQSVVGFTPSNNGHADIAGIAVICCQSCGFYFGVRLSEQVIPIYQEQCLEWRN